MQKIIIASSNLGKIKEIQAILIHYEVIPQQVFNIQNIEEIGLSFVENAILKARNASKHANLPAIADDSGLVVDALGGEPGIYSARYSGGSDTDNINKLLKNMQGITERTAQFYCAIAFVKNYNDPTPIICEASWQGEILEKPQGNNGFGYDSIFFISAFKQSAAELKVAEKNKISHRGLALQKLKKCL